MNNFARLHAFCDDFDDDLEEMLQRVEMDNISGMQQLSDADAFWRHVHAKKCLFTKNYVRGKHLNRSYLRKSFEEMSRYTDSMD